MTGQRSWSSCPCGSQKCSLCSLLATLPRVKEWPLVRRGEGWRASLQAVVSSHSAELTRRLSTGKMQGAGVGKDEDGEMQQPHKAGFAHFLLSFHPALQNVEYDMVWPLDTWSYPSVRFRAVSLLRWNKPDKNKIMFASCENKPKTKQKSRMLETGYTLNSLKYFSF